jgi:lipopolysaccharide/colanic/teichoic acid biosynthesis glycosyltransferase
LENAFSIWRSPCRLLLFSTVMAVVALLVRLKLGSPVLFRHQRQGSVAGRSSS